MEHHLPPGFLHDLKNHLATVLGFTELAIAQLPPDDQGLPDLLEIQRAAISAIELCRGVTDSFDHTLQN